MSDPAAIVDSFVRLTSRCLDALLTVYGGNERPTVWTGLWLVPRDGSDPVRSGVLEGLGSFHLHGIGCRFELDTGEDVDIDWDWDGRAVFNSWRLLMYAHSTGDETVTRQELRAAAHQAPSVVTLEADKFTFSHRRYDVTRPES
ncbi:MULTISPECIES: DUF6896 domain-containing protein [unclassified Pseudarthrobacter]|uniref:DUF6896 domain-containing protein n=1 Tax=unclassified Pseudarthrobacter TaxID=2647000 RepID=UPI003626D435